MPGGGHGPVGDVARLRGAIVRFRDHVDGWTDDVDPASGLTGADAAIIEAHIDYVLLFDGPGIPPIPPEPADDDAIGGAFARLSAFASNWPPDRVDPASGLTRADLDLIGSYRGPVWRASRPPVIGAGPPV